MKFHHAVLSIAAGLAFASAQAAAPSHSYVFTTGFSDANVGWSNANLTSTGLEVSWDGQLAISNVLSSPEYSVDFALSLARTDWQRKVLDFKGLTTDGGVYIDFGKVSFSDNAGAYVAAGAGSVADDTPFRLTFTRTSGGLFSGYLNGALQFSFDDSSSNLATFDAFGVGVGVLFKDDSAGCGYCQTNGTVSYFNVYDTALSAREVASITAVPEPQSAALVVAGLLTAGSLLKRRRRG